MVCLVFRRAAIVVFLGVATFRISQVYVWCAWCFRRSVIFGLCILQYFKYFKGSSYQLIYIYRRHPHMISRCDIRCVIRSSPHRCLVIFQGYPLFFLWLKLWNRCIAGCELLCLFCISLFYIVYFRVELMDIGIFLGGGVRPTFEQGIVIQGKRCALFVEILFSCV